MRRIALPIALLLAGLLTPALFASSLQGVVKDPSGAVIPQAQITLKNQTTGDSIPLTSDANGVFVKEAIPEGQYLITVHRDGFEDLSQPVTVAKDAPATVTLTLKLAQQETEVEVSGKRSSLANSDPNYRAFRDGSLVETYAVKELVLKRDMGAITLHSGQVSFLAPVLGKHTLAVFSGQGSFHLDPAIKPEVTYLELVTDKASIDEDFESLVLVFTEDTYDEIKKQAQPLTGSALDNVLKDFHHKVRYRTESPRSLTEYLLSYEGVPNIEAEVLNELYNPSRPRSFCAYIHGKKHGDLRFLIKPNGALPELSPEEVSVVYMDTANSQEGVWYLTHLVAEWKGHTASNDEDKRIVAADHYRIETIINKREHLAGIAEVRFEAMGDGDRVVGFGLLPNLRAIRVTEQGKDIAFIQESRRQDGSFYVVLPAATQKGKKYEIKIEYEGDKVVMDEGGGNFAVGARTSWYPSLNAFRDRATYDLIFKVPHQYTLIGVGKLVSESREGDYGVSEWNSDVPIAVAGFNYGVFKKKQRTDETDHYQVEAYATSELPAYMRSYQMPGAAYGNSHIGMDTSGMSPAALAESAMIDGMNAIRCFTLWFGEAPYGRIAITQQPQFNFGQSWPTLVYLPVSAFLDSTQRWELLGRNAFRFAQFIDEVTPHEVSHQWWGHMVGWASIHDQWLSEGFADFSAGLFLEQTDRDKDAANKYWERHRKQILDKNSFGKAANDAGPIWMGLRLDTYRTERAYNNLVYPKGGYILYMLRGLMWDPQTGDKDFIDMMHDFVKTFYGKNPSTEDFAHTVEKHMKKSIDLEGNGKITWFFREWVFGTEIPSYKLTYSLTPGENGKTLLTGSIAQSGVSPNFAMRVPIYLDFDGKPTRLANLAIVGNSSTQEFKVPLPKKPKRVLLNAHQDVLAASVTVEGK